MFTENFVEMKTLLVEDKVISGYRMGAGYKKVQRIFSANTLFQYG
ncbi:MULTISPECIES: hypothetical protein [Virgibacillus]|nr:MULTISPECIES: hypothetical protein [Virgibacillus]MEB5453278.1 hypothetical protein [Virgibacillus pantothenticus]MEB5457527.1 hypothetical protein [Virgibacillus pantothenticus]MEB5461602.1 hypothetical protein [Virgibacillus pantothenticus]MEB5465846.1 hypothetical protein [Virgibacillus pantothenticus]MEB5470145.1 hypothetical protein [Virgibacillus pantothenticus]